jgi:hypothetical protein
MVVAATNVGRRPQATTDVGEPAWEVIGGSSPAAIAPYLTAMSPRRTISTHQSAQSLRSNGLGRRSMRPTLAPGRYAIINQRDEKRDLPSKTMTRRPRANKKAR